MNTSVTKKEFAVAESKMFDLLSLATQKGGFDNLSVKEKLSFNKYDNLINKKEEVHSFSSVINVTICRNCIILFRSRDLPFAKLQ